MEHISGDVSSEDCLLPPISGAFVAQIIDLYTTTLEVSEYIAFAKKLRKHATIKCTRKGHTVREMRHHWPACKRPSAFLTSAVKALRALLERPMYAVGGVGAKSLPMAPPLRRTRSTTAGIRRSLRAVVGMVTLLRPAKTRAVSPEPQHAPPRGTPPKRPPASSRWRVAKYRMRLAAPKLEPKTRQVRAATALFARWASPLYTDIDPNELRLLNPSYVGSRRHADDERVIRLADLSMMLSEATLPLPRGASGLPHLLALYHFLDYDGDGWITQEDFVTAVVESVIDPSSPKRGPCLPQATVRGGPHRTSPLFRRHVRSHANTSSEARRTKTPAPDPGGNE